MVGSRERPTSVGASRCRRPVLALLLVTLAAGALFVACGPTPQTTIEPTTEQARRSLDLLQIVLWGGVAVFVLVEGALVYALIRYRRRSGDALPNQTHGHRGLEIAWTIAPTVLIVGLVAVTLPVIFFNARPPQQADPLQVQAIGHQWWFEFRYPDLGVVTANELHLPRGREVEIEVESEDVVHSFWVPQLRGKIDMFPVRRDEQGRVTGRPPNRLIMIPEQVGTFIGQCAEFCGVAHALMKLTVVVEEPEQFDAWAARQLEDRAPPQGEVAQQGEELLVKGGCIACHTIRGTIAAGVIGPDLTHMGGRAHIASGILPNTPENLTKWLSDPQAVKPGNKMVTSPLNDEEIDALVIYLGGLQ